MKWIRITFSPLKTFSFPAKWMPTLSCGKFRKKAFALSLKPVVSGCPNVEFLLSGQEVRVQFSLFAKICQQNINSFKPSGFSSHVFYFHLNRLSGSIKIVWKIRDRRKVITFSRQENICISKINNELEKNLIVMPGDIRYML